MKRIFAILFLCFYTTQSHAIFWAFSAINEASKSEEEKRLEEEEEKKKKHFIGFSVGAGIMDLGSPILNPRIWKVDQKYLEGNSLNIALSLEGGWQKYTYEKVGYQVIFRGRINYATDFKSPIFNAPKTSIYKIAFLATASAGIDGIFDFVKSNENSFGMILGINAGAGMIWADKDSDAGVSLGLNTNLRTGFQVGLPTGFIDLTLELPLIPLFFPKEVPYNYTLSLGYKHFF